MKRAFQQLALREEAISSPESRDHSSSVSTRIGSMLRDVSALLAAGVGLAAGVSHPDVKDYVHEVIHSDSLSFSSKELSVDHLSSCLAQVESKIETGEMQNATDQQKVLAAVFIKKNVLNPLKELARIQRGGPDVQNNYQALPKNQASDIGKIIDRVVKVLSAIYASDNGAEQLYAALHGAEDSLIHSAEVLGCSQNTLDAITQVSESARGVFFTQISSELGGLSIEDIRMMPPEELRKACLEKTGDVSKVEPWLSRRNIVLYFFQGLEEARPDIIASSSEG
jgi:hypothetical protein